MEVSKPMERQIKGFIDTLPWNGEWHKRASRDIFIEHMTRLVVVYHVSFEAAKNMLEDLHNAMAAEYGD